MRPTWGQLTIGALVLAGSAASLKVPAILLGGTDEPTPHLVAPRQQSHPVITLPAAPAPSQPPAVVPSPAHTPVQQLASAGSTVRVVTRPSAGPVVPPKVETPLTPPKVDTPAGEADPAADPHADARSDADADADAHADTDSRADPDRSLRLAPRLPTRRRPWPRRR